MNKVYGRILLLILLILVISGVVIYSTVDINTIRNLHVFQPWSVALAILAITIGLILDGTRLMHLVKISGERITLKQSVQVVFGNYFLALLGPGAAAGAVAQIMFLKKAGVCAGKAAVLVLVRTMVSIYFLVCCLPFIFLVDEGILPGVSNQLMMVVSAFCCAAFWIFVFAVKRGMLDYFAIKIAKRLSRGRSKSFIRIYRESQEAIRLLSKCPLSMLRVFIESGLSLIFLYMVVPCLMMGLGAEVDWLTVMGRMIFLNILLYFSPTPGGSGIAEGGFIYLFNDSIPAGMVGILAVSWRVIAEYLPFVIGLYYTITVFGRSILNSRLDDKEGLK